MKQRDLSTVELTDILDSLQAELGIVDDSKNVTCLKGSYGIYLYYLRNKDPELGSNYVRWLEQYNEEHQLQPAGR